MKGDEQRSKDGSSGRTGGEKRKRVNSKRKVRRMEKRRNQPRERKTLKGEEEDWKSESKRKRKKGKSIKTREQVEQ